MNKFEFFEIVKINENCKHNTSLVGLEGTVLGMAKDEQGIWSYAVSLDKLGKTYSLMESQLEPTGKKDDPNRIYDGSSIKVKVDPETGEGDLA
jgi:hypothetical protein